MARLLGIAIKPHGGEEMQLLDEAELNCAEGIVGDSRGAPGPRQVTLLSLAAWRAACSELGVDLPWQGRRANLLVDDLPLTESRGGRIRLGEALLEITGETDPCSRMTRLQPGLFEALAPEWRGGVTCRVLRPGRLCIGMAVSLTPAAAEDE